VSDDRAASGLLSVVGTPIGNLSDLSPRAAETLSRADVVVCEDSRRTGKLLAHLGARRDGRPELVVANEHTEVPRLDLVLDRLAAGLRVALVSDAGMPTISDPGRHVVAAAAEAGHRIEVVPGPTAISSALALSGLVADRFVFEGFLPRKGRERAQRLVDLASDERAVVLYESPKRVAATLADLAAACGPDRSVVVARELTKLHETVLRSTLGQVGALLDNDEQRGEFVVVLGPNLQRTSDIDDDRLEALLRAELAAGRSTRDAVAEVMAATGAAKRRVYALALGLDGAEP
jgi:16S rRNA (cytidine1402-2'-O)-methyltransferase